MDWNNYVELMERLARIEEKLDHLMEEEDGSNDKRYRIKKKGDNG